MANLKQIKSKIKSVSNIKKITRALEVVSTVKLQKTKSLTEALKEYLVDLIALISQVGIMDQIFETHPNQDVATKPKKLLIVLSSAKGLCGALNSRIFRKVIQEQDVKDPNTEMFVVGKKGIEFFKRAHAHFVGTLHVSDALQEAELLPLYSFFDEVTKSGAYSEVVLYFNYFKNSIMQIPTALRVFPLSQGSFNDFIKDLEMTYALNFTTKAEDFKIEPSLEDYITEVKRQVRNYVLLSAMVQNKTGEHAARMIAMKNAKDNATTFVKHLTLHFNKARQGAITQEISEIVSAKIAIEG